MAEPQYIPLGLEEEPEASIQDGIPRYGESLSPLWGDSLAEAAENSRTLPNALTTPLDRRESDEVYVDEDSRSEVLLTTKPWDKLFVPDVDPDHTNLNDLDLDPVKRYAGTIPGAEQPESEEDPEGSYIRDGVNFLFGEDLAILGIKWDQSGLDWKLENAIEQWSESPIMSSIAALGLVASTVFPMIGVVRKSAKVGMLATKGITKYADDATRLARLATPTRKGILGIEKAGARAAPFGESSLLKYGDDWQRTALDMLDVETELGAGVLKHFEPQQAARWKDMILTGQGDKAIQEIGIGNIKKRLLGYDHRRRFEELRWKVDFGTASPLERMKYGLQKRFANDYFMLGAGLTPQTAKHITSFFDDAKFWKPFREAIPEEHHDLWFKYVSGLVDENDEAMYTIAKGMHRDRPTKAMAQWRAQREAYKQQQRAMIDSGFFTEEEVAGFQLFGDKSTHVKIETVSDLPARGMYTSVLWNTVRTPGAMEVTKKGMLGGRVISKVPSVLASPSLQNRLKYGTVEAVEAGLEAGKIITDPALVNQFSLVHDKLLLNTYDFLADSIIKSRNTTTGMGRFFIDTHTFGQLTDKAKDRWVNLNYLGDEIAARFGIKGAGPLAERLKRMVAKKLNKNVDDLDDLPLMNVEIFNDFFHPEEGVFAASQYATDALSLLTAVHKTAKTALNPATHLTNLSGNFVMLAMAGMNPFSGQAIADGSAMAKVFTQIAHGRLDKEVDSSLLFTRQFLEGAFDRAGVNPIMTTPTGATIDLIDDLAHPAVRQLIEENSFETVEGFVNLQKTLNAINQAEGTKVGAPLFTKNVAKFLTAAIGEKKSGRPSKLGKGLHRLSTLYLQEDMIPKLMYHMKLRRAGFSVDDAVLEVGRRLPQYRNVGNSIKGMRRFSLPWITFPAEMTRIMKNNLQDFPLRTAAILRTPALMQQMAGLTGLGPETQDEVSEGMRQAPYWAQHGSAVLLNGGKSTSTLLAGSTGAFSGAVLGGAGWGAIGAMVGAAAGGLGGAAAGYFGGPDEEEQHMRSWVMNFLPWASLMPATKSPDAPTGSLQELTNISPIEPFAVLMPLMRLATGKGDWGEEMPVSGASDAVGKATMSLFGFVAPPLMQKYGLRVGEPDTGFFNIGDQGGRLGAAMVGGLLGAAGGPVGAAIGAGTGGIVGSNTVRLEEDLGMRPKSASGERGNLIYDVLLNSFTGTGKSWAATPEQRLRNENMRRGQFETSRRVFQKNLDSALQAGNEEMFNKSLGEIHRSFLMEYDDPSTALVKYGEYIERRLDKIGQHPRLRGISTERLQARLWEAIEFAREHRSRAANDIVKAIQKELMVRAMAQETQGLNVAGYDYDVNLATGLLGPASLAKIGKAKKKSKGLSGGGLSGGGFSGGGVSGGGLSGGIL